MVTTVRSAISTSQSGRGDWTTWQPLLFAGQALGPLLRGDRRDQQVVEGHSDAGREKIALARERGGPPGNWTARRRVSRAAPR